MLIICIIFRAAKCYTPDAFDSIFTAPHTIFALLMPLYIRYARRATIRQAIAERGGSERHIEKK